MSRTDCIRLGLLGALLVAVLAALPVDGQEPEPALATINALRAERELAPLSASVELDTVAAAYLRQMIETRCLCPAADGDAGATRLVADVRDAIGSETAWLDVGLVVGYDQSAAGAVTTTVRDPANGSVVLGPRMTVAGIATAIIDTGADWLVPPPGGGGPEIDLSGYTVVVIVTVGTGQ